MLHGAEMKTTENEAETIHQSQTYEAVDRFHHLRLVVSMMNKRVNAKQCIKPDLRFKTCHMQARKMPPSN